MFKTDNPTALRIGLLGCANIAKKNILATLQASKECRFSVIASRTAEKATTFLLCLPVDETSITCLTGSTAYDDLIQSSDVDAVYIPLPSALHKEWVVKALSAGKHVLLEKPVALSVEDYNEMLQVAKENNKFLMDGTMFVHHPRTNDFVRKVQNKSVVGTLQRIEIAFSFCGGDQFLQNNIRVKSDLDPLGCLGDLAWYCVRLALLVVGPESGMTSAQVMDYQLNADGVPIDATCLVRFQNNVVLSFHCGFCTHYRQYVHVVGSERGVTMDDFVLPRKHPVHYTIQSDRLTDFDLITERTEVQVEEFGGVVQEVLMWKAFSRFAKAVDDKGWTGDSEDCREALALSHVSATNQKILDALMASIHQGGAKIEMVEK